MGQVQYGSNWLSMQRQQSDARKPRLNVNRETEKQVDAKIRELQSKRDSLYANTTISDEELSTLEKPINDEIEKLINSKYETQVEINRRLSR